MAVEVKICGITNATDAVMAARAGASYLGVVLASGPRLVDEARAREVAEAAGSVPVLGVFGAMAPGDIAALCRRAGLAGAQLHGRHAAADAEWLRGEGLIVWRVARVGAKGIDSDLAELTFGADAVLLEPRVEGVDGGAGVALEPTLVRAARAGLAGTRLVLAGGLRPDTVAAAIGAVGPDVVDVSSGVERAPGRKAVELVTRFVEAVRACGD